MVSSKMLTLTFFGYMQNKKFNQKNWRFFQKKISTASDVLNYIANFKVILLQKW